MSKKHFQQVIGTAIILSILFVNSVFGVSANENSTNETSYNWDGTAAKAYAGGSGTESDPYRITNAGELARMVENKDENGKYFSIENDIIINDTTSPEWYKSSNLHNWYGVEFKSENAFQGTIYGNGHKITGLYYKETSKTNLNVGLIPIAWDTTIYDLTVDNSYFETPGQGGVKTGVGAFIGINNNATINIFRCTAGENITIKLTTESDTTEKLKAGGFIGVVPTGNGETKIYNSISAVHFDTKDLTRCGGFIGDCWGGDGKIKIERSVSAVKNAQLIQNYWSGSDFTDTYVIAKGEGDYKVNLLTSDQMKGENAKTNMQGLLWDYLWYTREDNYPVVKKTAGDINGDDRADICDLVTAKEHIDGTAALEGINFNYADLDRNSKVNSDDLDLLRKILLGIDAGSN